MTLRAGLRRGPINLVGCGGGGRGLLPRHHEHHALVVLRRMEILSHEFM